MTLFERVMLGEMELYVKKLACMAETIADSLELEGLNDRPAFQASHLLGELLEKHAEEISEIGATLLKDAADKEKECTAH
jgi:hypothetical protein